MSSDVKIDPIQILEDRVNQCIGLSVTGDKYEKSKELIHRAVGDLLRINFVDGKEVIVNFSKFVNKSLSTVEILGLNEQQYRAARKLILNEIYGCRDYVLMDKGFPTADKIK